MCDLMNDSVFAIINIIFILSMKILSLLWQQSFSACGENDLEQVRNCTPAKCLSAEKYQDDIASDAYNPTQLSSTKLVKHINKEWLTFSLFAFLKTCHRLLRSYLTCMC